MGVESAHFAFADIDLVAAYAPEIAVLKTSYEMLYKERLMRCPALAPVLFVERHLVSAVNDAELDDASCIQMLYGLCLNKRHTAFFSDGLRHRKFFSADSLMRILSLFDLYSRLAAD